MTISSLDGVLAGAQSPRLFSKVLGGAMVVGRPFSFWARDGIPGAGSYDNTLNGLALSAPQNGQIPFNNPGAGISYLSRFIGGCTQAGSLLLLDRLWHNGGITINSTSPQVITSPTFPARDNAGSTNGDGVFLGVEVSSNTGSGTPTLTASYTNQAGTSGRSGTNINPTAASTPNGNFFPLSLQAGDTGVRSVQSLTLSATWTSGVINLVAYRILAQLDLAVNQTPNAIDAITGGFPPVYNDSVPYLAFIPGATTTSNIHGSVNFTQG